MPTVTVTFVQATFVLATYVHIRNISAVTVLDPTNILNQKLFWPLNFWDLKIFLDPQIFGQNFSDQKFFGNNFFPIQYILDKTFLKQNISNLIFFRPKIITTQRSKKNFHPNFFGPWPNLFLNVQIKRSKSIT